MRLLKSLYYQLIETVNTFRENGLETGLKRLGQIIRRIFYVRRDRWVLALNLTESSTAIEPLPGLTVRQVTTDNDLKLMADVAGTVDGVRFERMLKKGALAFIAFQDDHLAGWGWLTDKIDLQTNRMQAPLAPGDACLYDLYVLPAYRGQRIAQRLVAHRLRFLYEQGYKRSVISCAKDDTPPLIVARRVGYVTIGESYHARFVFWDRYKYKPFEAEEKYRVQTTIPVDETG